jgi:DNA-binding NarL/FixJ family response regulator
MGLRLVLADDHQLMRDGLRALIRSGAVGDAEVVGEADTVSDTKRVVAEARPDVVIVDLKMPGGSSVELIRELVLSDSSLKVLVLTMYEETAFLRSVIAAGAHGYLLKRAAPNDLSEALASVQAGQLFIDRSLRVDLEKVAVSVNGPGKLTPREREVLVLLARGLTYNEVGRRLHIGARTVETHRRKLAEKLGLETRADLLRLALEFGLIKPGDVDEYDRSPPD